MPLISLQRARTTLSRSNLLLASLVVLAVGLVSASAVSAQAQAEIIPDFPSDATHRLHDVDVDDDDASWARPILRSLQHHFALLGRIFRSLPGSPIVMRYVTSSYQDDPFRTLLELLLIGFAIRTILQQRTQSQASGSNFVALTESEIDGLVKEFDPEPLCTPLNEFEQWDLESVPLIVGPNGPRPLVKAKATGESEAKQVLNLGSFNFTDLASQPEMKARAIQTLRQYGVGSCSPPGFYGTIDVHMDLESNLAKFLGTERAIVYAQGFTTTSSVIPAFCKRGDVIVADRGVNYSIQKGIQISRSTVRWYEHNSLTSLARVLESITRDNHGRKRPLTRRFIITEGIFENDGQLSDLSAIVQLAKKHKFRILLDEGLSFGTIGKTGKGSTELFGVPATDIDILTGNLANTLGSAGGFVAGSSVVEFHQRINSPGFVYSAALPALNAVAASTAIERLQADASSLRVLQDNIRIVRAVLDLLQSIDIPSHSPSPIIHLRVRSTAEESQEEQARKLQAVADKALQNGVLLVRSRHLPSINSAVLDTRPESDPTLRLAISSAFSKEEIERAAQVVRQAIVDVLGA